MINKEEHPVGWAMLMYELKDASDHLSNLIAAMEQTAEYDDATLRVDLGHIYSHLNRAWHRRDSAEDLSESEWDIASNFPTDLHIV